MSAYERIYSIDWTNVTSETFDKLNNQSAQIINGVARDSNTKSIIQHMPFKEINAENVDQLLPTAKSLQNVQLATTATIAASTAVIMGAIILSTAYLSKKINSLNQKIDQVYRAIQEQNKLFYINKISEYFGSIKTLRFYISSEAIVNENKDLIKFAIVDAATKRNQLMSFLENLIYLVDSFDKDHKSFALDFINNTIDILPKGVFVESQAAFKTDKIILGEYILEDSYDNYITITNNYKNYINQTFKEKILPGLDVQSFKALEPKIDETRQVIYSEENKILLTTTV